MKNSAFEKLVADALESLPENIRQKMDNGVPKTSPRGGF
jgi:predicted Zn-dependent protease with MMP-like domain